MEIKIGDVVDCGLDTFWGRTGASTLTFKSSRG